MTYHLLTLPSTLSHVVTLPLAFGCPGGVCPMPTYNYYSQYYQPWTPPSQPYATIEQNRVINYQAPVYQPVVTVQTPVYRVAQPRRFRLFRRCR